jgi:predicted amino acid dehydrogenase
MLLGAFRGGNPLIRIVGNPLTEFESAWASALILAVEGKQRRFPRGRRVSPLRVVGSDGLIQHSVKALDEGGWVL